MNQAWRRHWKIPVGLAVLVGGLLLAVGQTRVIAYVGAGADTEVGSSASVGVDYANDVELFDASVVHTIELDFDQADLDAAITVYMQSGEKEWFLADITIDGVTIEEVGVRMKGNSTLQSALRSGADPNVIPFLVKLSKYTAGVSYQGFSELALRTEGPRGDDLILEETVTADVLEIADLPFPETSYTGLSINGGDETLRVVVELLDNGYVERLFDDTGVLYKAQSGDSFTYLGHDPLAYEGAFTQETANNEADLEPLIDLLEFVDTASDEEFENELGDWLDIESFVSYIAVNNLLASVDSMPGNGNNYYLWYDTDDDQSTVLAWDLNESFGGFWMSQDPSTDLLPDWSNVAGSQAGGGAGVRPGVEPGLDNAGAFPPVEPGVGDVGGSQPVEPGVGDVGGSQPVEPGVGDVRGRPAGEIGAGGRGGRGAPVDDNQVGAVGGGDVAFDYNNPLVDRFLTTDSFLVLYLERYAELYEVLFTDGAVNDFINVYSALLDEANSERGFVAGSELAAAVNAKLLWVTDRSAFLDAELGGG